ncbi:MAG TPA: farnesyl diphosphate synthase [Vicinamibacterales bacterium]|nr:farnesyl diphosphate synthase [Vicinamibacterales bacterium]
MTFEAYLETRRKQVESALEEFLSTSPAAPTVLADAMRYSLLGGGKRLRPMLVMASAEGVAQAIGVSEAAARDAALPAACAIEMIHTYSLIHDDLPSMDDDDLRRGRPTSHVVHGEGMAILAGDGLQAEAFRLLAREPQGYHPTLMMRKLKVISIIGDAAGAPGMVGGQALDLNAIKPPSAKATGGISPTPSTALTPEGLRDMHARKTGALIRASVAAGAIMGGATDSLFSILDQYGTEIGLAFQIVDDILDEEGSAASLGKTAGKDRAAGKPTYPAFFGLERSRELAAECHANARRALEKAGLLDSRLADIASWIIERKT